MCKFMSILSDGKGNAFFFKLDDIIQIEKDNNNSNNYNWNSHSSIASYYKINEDKMNKWEYNNETKELKLDGTLITKENDLEEIKIIVEKYISENNPIFLQKIYSSNSGDWNSGSSNSGDWNSGDWNSGSRNSGSSNSGSWNSGDWNSGSSNSGSSNSGDWNSGSSNSGSSNSGSRNSGYWNSGSSNSGYSNSGSSNSGYSNSGSSNSGSSNSGSSNSGSSNSGSSNSGSWNSGDRNSGYLNTITPKTLIFNKTTTKKNINFPNYFYFELNIWVSVSNMTDEEKQKIGWYKTTEGYLKKIEYKEAWKLSFDKAEKDDVALTLKLPNFNYKIFEEISGITKKMIQEKLK
jgi:hypothetical protein